MKRPASPGRLAAVAVLVAIPTLAVQAVLVLGGVAVALTWMRATVGASWGWVLAMVVALEALLAMLLGAALVVGVPWRAAALLLDAWLIIGGFARGAVGVLLLTITGG